MNSRRLRPFHAPSAATRKRFRVGTSPSLFEARQVRVSSAPTSGRRWFLDWPAHEARSRGGRRAVSPDNPERSPDGPYFKGHQEAGGSYKLQPLRAHPRGTYETRSAPRGTAKACKPPAAQSSRRRAHAASLLTGHGAGRYAFRGCAEIVARFKAKGIEFRPIGDCTDALVTAAGGTSHYCPARRHLCWCRRRSCRHPHRLGSPSRGDPPS